MSTLKARSEPSVRTLACLVGLLDADPTLVEAHRREMKSAISTIAKVLNTPPHLIPAAADQLSALLRRALPSAVKVSPARFSNAKSLLRKALALYDPQVIPARTRAVLLPEWKVLIEALTTKPLERGLARFSKHCSLLGIRPHEVTQEVYERFHTGLAAHCLLRSPRETQQTAGRAWNEAVRSVPGWPQTVLTIADFRRNPSMPWTAFPNSLVEEIKRYLAPRSQGPFKFSNRTPTLSASTIDGNRAMLRQYLTCLVQSGRDPATLRSLKDIVTMEAAEAGLEVLHNRVGGQNTARAYSVAYLLYGIAKHELKLSPAIVAEFKEGCRSLRPIKDGMTLKNRMRLKQFDDPRKLKALLELPATMMNEACRGKEPPTKAEARIAQLAIAIELLLSVPLRIKNVSELELGRTLILQGKTGGTILIALSEVKNKTCIEAPLPMEFLRMLKIYLERFHPLLAPPGCKMVFPSADGGHKRTTVLSDRISKTIGQRCGLEMNSHLFRHLAAWLLLEACPGAYGLVRMLLGHKSVNTTTTSYCNKETVQAFRLHDKNIAKLRKEGVLHRGGIPAVLGRP